MNLAITVFPPFKTTGVEIGRIKLNTGLIFFISLNSRFNLNAFY